MSILDDSVFATISKKMFKNALNFAIYLHTFAALTNLLYEQNGIAKPRFKVLKS